MTLAERLSEYVRACFTGIWIKTFESDDALHEISGLCRQQGWALATWDIDRGLDLAFRAVDVQSVTRSADRDELIAMGGVDVSGEPNAWRQYNEAHHESALHDM